MHPLNEDGTERNLFFDTDCMGLLEEKWHLSKKKIQITGVDFYFTNDENISITPLSKANRRGNSGAIWNKAYQSIKHNRQSAICRTEYQTRNLPPQATLKNFIWALGSLYILNLYYKNETFYLGKDDNGSNFDLTCGSDVFSVNTSKIFRRDIQTWGDPQSEEIESSIYIFTCNDKSEEKIIETERLIGKETEKLMLKKLDELSPSNDMSNYEKTAKNFISTNLPNCNLEALKNINHQHLHNLEYEAIINKNFRV